MTMLLSSAFGLLLQSTALLGLGLLALRLARRRGPAVQSLVGRATLAGIGLALLLAAPLTGRIQPLWHVTLPIVSAPPAYNPGREDRPPTPNSGGAGEGPTPAHGFATPPGAGGEGVSDEAKGVTPGVSTGLGEGAASSAPTPRILTSSPSRSGRVAAQGFMRVGGGVGSLFPALIVAWGSGTALLLLWLGVCQRHLTRLRRQASPVPSGPAVEMLAGLTPRPPALLAHPSIRSPFLAGLRRPAIFLPETYETDFDPTALRAILAHELAHLARRDNAWSLAARLLSALLWPQPLLWVLCRRLDQIGEEACDQAVLAQDCPPRAYADCLLTLAERHPLGRRERALGAGIAPFRSSLGRRIGRILDKGTHTMSTVTPRLRLTAAALAIAAAFGGAFLVSSAPAQVSSAPVLPSSQPGISPLVGTWLGPDHGGTHIVFVFSEDSKVEQIGHWPGESREIGHSYDSNTQVYHSYGRYAAEESKLRYTLTRVWVEGQKPWATDPEKHVMDYSLSGDVLTLRLKGKWMNVYHRVPAYTKAMLGIYRKSPAHATQGFVVQSYLGTTPVGPARVISAAEMTTRRDFMADLSASHPDPELSNARFLAGLTPVQGPGVVVTLNDSKQRLPKNMPPGMTPPNIIHDTDINQVVNELKAAGAEAIAVNDQRLVATSSIRDAGPTIFVNNTPQVPPFVIKAIGNPKTLSGAMNIPGGIATQLKAYDPRMFSVQTIGTMRLPAYFDLDTPRYAKPIPNDAQTRRQATDFSKQGTTELKSLATRLDAKNTSMEAKLTALRRKDEWNRDQEAALGKASHTITALQTLDRQCASLQLRILLNTQGNQTASRRADTNVTQQTLRTLKSHRAQVAQTLPPQQERDFEAKSHYYLRQEMALGIDMLRIKVAQQENRRQSMAAETRLETLKGRVASVIANY